MMTLDMLDEKMASFLAACQDAINAHYAKNYKNLDAPTLTVERNPKYWRVVRNEASGGRSVYCFIEAATGDVLKADGWKRPAKGVRGNLFDESNGLARMTPYGTEYNK